MRKGQYIYKAKIVKVYDGDTVTAVIDLGMGVTKTERIRLRGINAPEVRGSEKIAGKRSRDALRGLILNQDVIIETIKDKKGKYGRYIGVIYYAGKSVNDFMVDSKNAVAKEY